MSDLVIRNPHGDSIAITDGYISAIGPDLPGASREINATGLAMLPGLIDIHVHFNEPGRTEWEGASTGSRAFAAGGGTLYFDMPLNSTPCTVNVKDFELKRAALAASSVTDFAIWGGIVPGTLSALPELAERGVIGFKAFMSDSGLPEFPRSDDRTLLDGMHAAAHLGLPVAVHAENEELTKHRDRATDIPAFLRSRPVIAEVEAITRACLLAREAGCKLHIVHISSGAGVAAALESRVRGTDVTVETCPHYLWFTEEDLLRVGALLKCAPPLRPRAERDSLLSALRRGDIDMVASDHSPCEPELKVRDDFFAIWGGIAGVQSTLSVLLELDIPLPQVAEVTANNPARRFGIPHKGSIAVGNHADLVLLDQNTSAVPTLRQRHPISPYAGTPFRGVIRQTLLRGRSITTKTRGQFVRPDLP